MVWQIVWNVASPCTPCPSYIYRIWRKPKTFATSCNALSHCWQAAKALAKAKAWYLDDLKCMEEGGHLVTIQLIQIYSKLVTVQVCSACWPLLETSWNIFGMRDMNSWWKLLCFSQFNILLLYLAGCMWRCGGWPWLQGYLGSPGDRLGVGERQTISKCSCLYHFIPVLSHAVGTCGNT